MSQWTLTVPSLEFWLLYLALGAKFFVLGSVWGWMRCASFAKRKLRELTGVRN